MPLVSNIMLDARREGQLHFVLDQSTRVFCGEVAPFPFEASSNSVLSLFDSLSR